MKVDRHSKIVELIGKYQIETQEELAEYLTYNQSSTPSQSTEFEINDPAFPGEKTTIKVFDTNALSNFLTESQIGDSA